MDTHGSTASGELELFRDAVRRFVETELTPNEPRWREQQHVDREAWRKAGELGLLLCAVPAERGGVGADVRYDAVVYEELARGGAMGFGKHVHEIVAHYVAAYGTPAQQQRWLPRMASGEAIAAIAMSEPGAGSDLQGVRTRAVRDGDAYVVNGSKTFISNGHIADLVLLVCKTDPQAGARGTSLIMVETAGLAGLPARPDPGQDRPEGAGHRGALLRRRPRPGGQPARRRGGHAASRS